MSARKAMTGISIGLLVSLVAFPARSISPASAHSPTSTPPAQRTRGLSTRAPISAGRRGAY